MQPAKRRSAPGSGLRKAPGRRVRERAARRQEILRAACEVFAESGYHEATLEEIARHAEFGKGTIYNYFSSKEELFDGIMMKLLDEIEELARQAMSVPGGAREKYTAYAKALLSFAARNSLLLRLVTRELIRLDFGGYHRKLDRLKERSGRTWQILAAPLVSELGPARQPVFGALELAALFDGMLRFCAMHRPTGLRELQPPAVEAAAQSVVDLFFDGLHRHE
jgi:AcrR family transcriptional regulator